MIQVQSGDTEQALTGWVRSLKQWTDGALMPFAKEIFTPLGMTDTAFEPDRLSERLADVKIRGEDGSFAPFGWPTAPARILWHGACALFNRS